jgi:hypothetical protein
MRRRRTTERGAGLHAGITILSVARRDWSRKMRCLFMADYPKLLVVCGLSSVELNSASDEIFGKDTGEIAEALIARSSDEWNSGRATLRNSKLCSAKILRQSCGIRHQAVLVMKSVQYGVRNNSAWSVETMHFALQTQAGIWQRIGKARPQRGVWSASIVMW